MVGRVIGKNGETIKALQTYTGALIQIDQTVDPTKVTISGIPHSLSLAVSMVTDIMKGTFKGFALLRTLPGGPNAPVLPNGMAQPRPVYAPGYGLIPPSQLYGTDERGGPPVDARGRGIPAGWPAAQGSPSQVILGMQPAGMGRPMGGHVMAPGVADDSGMLMGYAPMAMGPVYAYPPEYGMPGMMRGQEVLYQPSNGVIGVGAGGGAMGASSGTRLYQAAGGRAGGSGAASNGYQQGSVSAAYSAGMIGGGRGNNMSLMQAAAGGGDAANGVVSSMGMTAAAGGNWVHTMDANGQVLYVPASDALLQQ